MVYKNKHISVYRMQFHLVHKASYIDGDPETSITQGQKPQRILHLEEDFMSASTIILENMNLMQHSLPDMAGVSSPSPITIQVPRSTKISKAVCKDLCFSRSNFILELFLVSGGCSSLQVERASSATCLLGRRLTLACLHIKEQRAKVPPASNI